MKEKNVLWQLMGFAVTSLSGTVLHFLYDWLEKPFWIAPFSGVNESTWEHMKLLFWPMFIYAVAESFFFREHKHFWCIKLQGILFGLVLIPVIFYTYNGVVGKSPDWINIAIFFIAAAITYLYETRQLNKCKIKCKKPKLALAAIFVIAALFTIFTFRTPEINIFMDPITYNFGM